jgi:hypothetical protein
VDELIVYVLLDQDGTEVSEEFDTPGEARAFRDEAEWEPRVRPLRVARKTYVCTGDYEEVPD